MSMKLARDDRNSVLQVGSYRTDQYENIDGSAASAGTSLFDYNTIVRVKSLVADNWVTINTYKSNIITKLKVTFNGYPTETAIATYNGTLWAGTMPTVGDFEILKTGNSFQFYDGDNEFTATSTDANPPKSNWTANPTGTMQASGITVLVDASADYYLSPAVADTGMLLAYGDELTMLVAEDSQIATIGGELNIVPVAD